MCLNNTVVDFSNTLHCIIEDNIQRSECLTFIIHCKFERLAETMVQLITIPTQFTVQVITYRKRRGR